MREEPNESIIRRVKVRIATERTELQRLERNIKADEEWVARLQEELDNGG